MRREDLLRACSDDMRFVFIYDQITNKILEKKLNLEYLRRIFEKVETTKNFVKCSFPHASLTFVVFKIQDGVVTNFEIH